MAVAYKDDDKNKNNDEEYEPTKEELDLIDKAYHSEDPSLLNHLAIRAPIITESDFATVQRAKEIVNTCKMYHLVSQQEIGFFATSIHIFDSAICMMESWVKDSSITYEVFAFYQCCAEMVYFLATYNYPYTSLKIASVYDRIDAILKDDNNDFETQSRAYTALKELDKVGKMIDTYSNINKPKPRIIIN